MPVPTPQSDEERNSFISRCMRDETMVSEYEDTNQRLAICFSSWDQSQKALAPNENEDHEEYMIRCTTDGEMESMYPDMKERIDMCHHFWEAHSGSQKEDMPAEDEEQWAKKPDEEWSSNVELETRNAKQHALDYQTLDTRLQVKQVADEGDVGTFMGYASVFGNKDYGDDIIQRGAFTKTLKEMPKVKMLWQHDLWKPIGVWTDVHEDGYGLKVRGAINLHTQTGREAYALLKQGAIDGLSIGFVETQAKYDEDGARVITEAKLFEVSIVTLAMNEQARVMAVKDNNFVSKFKQQVIEQKQKEEQELAEFIASLDRLSNAFKTNG